MCFVGVSYITRSRLFKLIMGKNNRVIEKVLPQISPVNDRKIYINILNTIKRRASIISSIYHYITKNNLLIIFYKEVGGKIIHGILMLLV